MPLTAQEIEQLNARRHNARSLAGLTLRNATGDIDQTSLGYQYAITTLTTIKKQITTQKFYTVAPADYVPIVVGEGAFSQQILTNLVLSAAGDFEAGIIHQGLGNDRLNTVTVGLGTKTTRVVNWAKAVGYSIIEIEQALAAQNWDVVEAMMRARKENWDLGIQKTAFLGSSSMTDVLGLLTQSTVNSDLSTIVHRIVDMSPNQFANFVAAIVQAYQVNCAYTAYPNRFVIPQDDWNGLATPVSPTYPVNSKLEYLQKALDAAVPGGCKILPSPYSMPAQNGLGLYRYAMYRYDPTSIRMDIPVNFTATQAGTNNNFNFQDAAYGQYTGVTVLRNLELLYFDFAG